MEKVEGSSLRLGQALSVDRDMSDHLAMLWQVLLNPLMQGAYDC